MAGPGLLRYIGGDRKEHRVLCWCMRFATLVSWLVTVALGAFMLRTWLARGGLRRERARVGGLPPALIFGHAGLATTGLVIWAAYLAAGTRALAWAAVGALMLTVGLGLCTVTLWTPYPARRPGERMKAAPWDEPAMAVRDSATDAAEAPDSGEAAGTGEAGDPVMFEVTDEMIAALIEDQAPGGQHRPIRPNPAVLVPVAHGFAAISTFVLAVMAAST